jgi:hypothetical protein
MHNSKTERFLPEDEPGAILLVLSFPQQAPIKDVAAEQKQKVTLVTMQVTTAAIVCLFSSLSLSLSI